MPADGAVARVYLPVVVEGYAAPVRVRARTESTKRLSHRALARGAREYPERPGVDYSRPQSFAECESVGLGDWQPCPFVSCKHHLAIDVDPETGSIKHNFPGLDIDEMPETCSLHVAARGGAILEEVATVMNFTRERTRQLESRALAKIRAAMSSREWTICDDALDHLDEIRGER